eukprot:1161682-Pelagomonas_calceolata.AAC.4
METNADVFLLSKARSDQIHEPQATLPCTHLCKSNAPMPTNQSWEPAALPWQHKISMHQARQAGGDFLHTTNWLRRLPKSPAEATIGKKPTSTGTHQMQPLRSKARKAATAQQRNNECKHIPSAGHSEEWPRKAAEARRCL